jgi:hypothetical protein
MKAHLILLFLFIAFVCSCSSEKSIIVGSSAASSSTTSNIDNKTIIKSKVVELGIKSTPPNNSTLIVSIAENKELIIQCKELIINQDIQFTGTNVTLIIEYEKLISNNYYVKASVGSNGLYRLEKKKIAF